VRYPVLPTTVRKNEEDVRQELMEIRHASLYAPRDFDISPYFQIIKPTIERGFDYHKVHWADLPQAPEAFPVAPADTIPADAPVASS